MSSETSSTVMEKQNGQTIEPAAVSKCSNKSTANDQALQNDSLPATTDSPSPVNDDKMDEMFTDDIVNDLKQELADDATKKVVENGNEFTDQSDEQESKALEVKMKSSEKNEALQLFQQGKRNLLIEDFDAAVETLASACAKYSSIYGDLSAECGEVFMAYGQALIQLWRTEELNNKKEEESKPVGEDAAKGEKDEVAGETNGDQIEEEISETNDEQTAEEGSDSNEESEENVADITVNDAAGEVALESEKSSNEETPQQNENAVEDNLEGNDGDDDDDDDDEEDEDVDNLQLAWEIFETAKTIYSKCGDDANVAKAHSKLGEISIANCNYELAIEDLSKSLEIMNKFAAPKARQLADTHFQLYTAYSANYNFDRAEIELRKAKNILEDELYNLQEKLTGLVAESDEARQVGKEVEELEKLTKDMQEKLIEFSASKRQVVSAISTTLLNKMESQKATPSTGETAGSSGSQSSNGVAPSSNVPVNNISHLVRKKPKNTADEKQIMTNGTSPLKSGDATESIVANGDSQRSKRKAEDVVDAVEPSPKKQCVI